MYKELFPKFVIVNDCLRLGKVVFHKELLNEGEVCEGGGWFHYNSEDNSFTFYGSSHDLGRATLVSIQRAVELGNVGDKRSVGRHKDHKFYYCVEIGDIVNKVALNCNEA